MPETKGIDRPKCKQAPITCSSSRALLFLTLSCRFCSFGESGSSRKSRQRKVDELWDQQIEPKWESTNDWGWNTETHSKVTTRSWERPGPDMTSSEPDVPHKSCCCCVNNLFMITASWALSRATDEGAWTQKPEQTEARLFPASALITRVQLHMCVCSYQQQTRKMLRRKMRWDDETLMRWWNFASLQWKFDE